MQIETVWGDQYDITELIEVSPHFRTIKIYYEDHQNQVSKYIHIPYTQFWFTDRTYFDNDDCKDKRVVFITNSLKPALPEKKVSQTIFAGNLLYHSSQICMGNIESPENNSEFISTFWLSTFLAPVREFSEIVMPKFHFVQAD